ncbi:MAG: 4-(cytidine 5'-diphospho)-2-C-methyl-D-erythritol kinase [Bacteroidaceae bacterium]|nr:4-(cytidine 5'-diphospho)-2-C-methyl-D-erythritol kinase [Bacteroidaceae bacterium]
MITYPNAKINLGLNIVEKRTDGYHNLETIFYPINLQDALEVTKLEGEKEYELTLSGTPIEGDPDQNLVIKAYRLLKKDFPDMPAIDIHMYKHIPTGAGLGGGSADAAFMIKLLNEKFKLSLSIEKMEEYAATLGADCAFFIQNKPVFATGIGNIFESVQLSLKGYYLVLVKPDIFVSTKDAFALIQPVNPTHSLKEIVRMPIETWRATMKNDFEYSVFQKYPEIAAIKDKLYDMGAIYASMSGSGSSVYGIFREQVEYVDEIFNGCFCRQRALE